MNLIGRDGSVWRITAGPSGRDGVHLNHRRHLPDWLDRLIDAAVQLLIRLSGWNRWP